MRQKPYTFDEITERGLLLFRYRRGSHMYGTNLTTSDDDEGGVYIIPKEEILGLRFKDEDYDECCYQPQISDKKNDKTWYEFGRYISLLVEQNATILESLFVPDEYVIYEHPMFKAFRNKFANEFVTKQCFKSFGSYANTQVKRSQGENKYVMWKANGFKRLQPLDFCYVMKHQGTQNIKDWLDERGLHQEYCGLVHLQNMTQQYALFYDWGSHFLNEPVDYQEDTANGIKYVDLGAMSERKDINFILDHVAKTHDPHMMDTWLISNSTPKHYRGIVSVDGNSNDVRVSSIPDKDAVPLIQMSFNLNGYQSHCREWRGYEAWDKNHNQARYDNDMEYWQSGDPEWEYDAKNMYHNFRLMAMCKEIALGMGVHPNRRGIDADFLKDVRTRKYKFSELNAINERMTKERNEAITNSKIKDCVDVAYADAILKGFRSVFDPYMDVHSVDYADALLEYIKCFRKPKTQINLDSIKESAQNG